MQGVMLVVLGHVHVDKLGPQIEHAANLGFVSATNCLGEAPDGYSIDESFQLGPTGKAVRAGHHELSVMKGELCWIGITVVTVNVGDCSFIASEKRLEQLFSLAFELIEVRAIG
jgi:hypothetical protein